MRRPQKRSQSGAQHRARHAADGRASAVRVGGEPRRQPSLERAAPLRARSSRRGRDEPRRRPQLITATSVGPDDSLSLSLKVATGSRHTLSEWDFLPCPCRSPGCLPEARPAMQSAAGPPGGSNPKRATGRSHRSADGASPAALDRSPRKWPDRPTRTAWPLPPLSAAQFAPSSLSGSSWHPSDSSRRSAAPTPCTLSQTRSSAGTLFGEKSPPAVHAEPASCRLARQPLPLDQPQLRHGHHFVAACSWRAGRRSKFAQTSARR